ncbi:MAG: hypothetical protein U9O96_03120 [Candidatus Thermoplasmatota archaeon]|nr:hypothetical protein [Candidatus Thermoplasmatota archaeon]
MRKKSALILALAISAIFVGSVHSNILYANQYVVTNIQSSYAIIGENTTTYDFSSGAGNDRWAYRDEVSQNPPSANNLPSTEFNSAQYNRISADDEIRQNERADIGNYAAHRFVFFIYENEINITLLHILWNGIGTHDIWTDGATLYIWNCTSSSYELLDTNTSAIEINLEANISSSIGNYISSDGNLTVLVVQNRPSFRFWWFRFYSRLQTDYIKVDITHTEG